MAASFSAALFHPAKFDPVGDGAYAINKRTRNMLAHISKEVDGKSVNVVERKSLAACPPP